MTTHTVYLLHAPYPDGSWRGLEKCSGATGDGEPCTGANPAGTLVFSTREEAEAFAHKLNLPGFYVVEAALVTPSIRQPLNSVDGEAVYAFVKSR